MQALQSTFARVNICLPAKFPGTSESHWCWESCHWRFPKLPPQPPHWSRPVRTLTRPFHLLHLRCKTPVAAKKVGLERRKKKKTQSLWKKKAKRPKDRTTEHHLGLQLELSRPNWLNCVWNWIELGILGFAVVVVKIVRVWWCCWATRPSSSSNPKWFIFFPAPREFKYEEFWPLLQLDACEGACLVSSLSESNSRPE